MSSLARHALLIPAVLAAAACGHERVLGPADVAAPREEAPLARVSELDSRAGFGVLAEAEGDGSVRALALRFVGALAEENTGQLRVMLQHATWQPGLSRGTPIEELSRRMAMQEFQALKLPLAQGAFDSMQVRVAPPTAAMGGAQAGEAGTFVVRLPTVALPEPLFMGRPVLHIARTGETLTITSYGEE